MNIRKLFFLTFLLSCFGCKVNIGTNEDEQFKPVAFDSSIDFAALKENVLDPSCVRCHSWANDEAAVQSRIVPGNPDASPFFQSIKNGSMPKDGALPSAKVAFVEKYIKNLSEKTKVPEIALNSSFKSINYHVIEKSCSVCHNDKAAQEAEENGEEIDSFEGYDNVKRRAKRILTALEEGELADKPMPPFNEDGITRKAPVPTKETIEQFKKWIEEGKLNN